MDQGGDFIVRTMSADEVAMSIEWAAAEGWNPGLHDPSCFRAADPAGFFIGVWRGEPVACLSAVAYDERFGFIGLYIVKPGFRGKGFGIRTWQHGMRSSETVTSGSMASSPSRRTTGSPDSSLLTATSAMRDAWTASGARTW